MTRTRTLKLAFLLIVLVIPALSQNTVTLKFAGTPTGNCAFIMRAVDTVNNKEYACPNGSWLLVGPGAAGSAAFSTLTGGTNSGQALVVGNGSTLTPTGTGVITFTDGPFAGITGGTSTNDAFLIGNGSTFGPTGTGAITATVAPFAGLTTGSNTAATMTCGTGCTITTSGSGANNATTVPFSGVAAGTSTADYVLGNSGTLDTTGTGGILSTHLLFGKYGVNVKAYADINSITDEAQAISAAAAAYPNFDLDATGFTGDQVWNQSTVYSVNMLGSSTSGTLHQTLRLQAGNIYISLPSGSNFSDANGSGVGTPAIIIPNQFGKVAGIGRQGTVFIPCTGTDTPVVGCKAFPKRQFTVDGAINVSGTTATAHVTGVTTSNVKVGEWVNMSPGVSATFADYWGRKRVTAVSAGQFSYKVNSGTADCASSCGTATLDTAIIGFGPGGTNIAYDPSGTGSHNAFTQQVENLGFDLANYAGAMAIQNIYGEEDSWARDITVARMAQGCISSYTATAQNSGDWKNITCSSSTSSIADFGMAPVTFGTAFQHSLSSFTFTVSATPINHPYCAVVLDSQMIVSDGHSEGYTNGVCVGGNVAVSGAKIELFGQTTVAGDTGGAALYISPIFTTSTNTIRASLLSSQAGGATYTVNDPNNSNTCTDTGLRYYETGGTGIAHSTCSGGLANGWNETGGTRTYYASSAVTMSQAGATGITTSNYLKLPEVSNPTFAAANTFIWTSNTGSFNHFPVMNPNNGSTVAIVGTSALGTVGNAAVYAANGKDITDAGAPPIIGSGTTNQMAVFTASNTIGGVSCPVTGSVATGVNGAPPACQVPGVSGRVVSGATATDTILCDTANVTTRDRATLVEYKSSLAVAVTLPQAGSTGCAGHFAFRIKNTATSGTANDVTVTPTTSTINGNATLVVHKGESYLVTSMDDTNYVSAGGANYTAGSNISLTPSSDGQSIAVASSAGSIGGVVAKTGSYTLTSSESGKLVTFNSAGACVITLNATPAATDIYEVQSIGATLCTVSLNSTTYNGASTVPVLLTDVPMKFFSDGTNYFGQPPLKAGSGITGTPGTANLTIAVQGAAGQILAGSTPALTATPTIGVQNTTQGIWTIAGSAASPGQLVLNIAGASANALTIQPGANAGGVTLTGPTTGGTIPSTATSPVTLSAAGAIACATCVTSAAALTSTALVTGGGLQASQTPSATSTLDASGNAIFAGSAKAPFFVSADADPADAGAIRLGNAELIAWEASPAGTDVTLTVNTSEQLVSSGNVSAPAFISTVATGTAPFTVSSTTNVANLNASSLSGATFAAPGAIGGGTPAAGSFTTLTGTTYNTTTRCAAAGSAANPSAVACSAAPSGSFSCATNASTGTCVVSTTAVTANSAIFVQPDSSLGTLLSVTCNTTADTGLTAPRVSARSAGTSFTITLGTFATNPLCYSYMIVN